MSERKWFPIDTAPKDGTVVRVRNSMMRPPFFDPPYVDAKFGTAFSIYGDAIPNQWGLVKDYTKYSMMRAGAFLCPTEWQPIPQDGGSE